MNLIYTCLRTFKRFKFFTAINVLGISLGLICSLVILLYVQFQLSFDNFHADKDRIFRISEISTSPDRIYNTPNVRVPVGQDFKDAFAEIESFTHVGVQIHQYLLKYDDQAVSIEKVIYTSHNFFSFFSFETILGNKSDLLQNNDAAVITEKIANNLFGTKNPVGEKVILNNKNYIVTGVVKNPPINSHIQFDVVLSIEPVINQPGSYISWDGGLSIPTFIKLKQANSRASLESKIPDLVWEKVNKKIEGSGFFTELYLEPLTDIHSKSKVDWDGFGIKKYSNLLTLLFIGMTVLLVALANYLFLTNGILSLRFKEFGIKRYFGIGKQGIIKQLWVENTIIFGFSTAIALILIYFLSDVINTLFGSKYILPELVNHLPYILIEFIGLVALSTLLQFVFLTKTMSLNQSFVNFKKTSKTQKSLWVTTIQFAASIALIISIITIYKQLSFINHKDLGFKAENIINISHDNIGSNQEVLKSEFSKIPGVINVSASYGIPGLECTMNGYVPEGSQQWLMFNALHVDDNFFNTFNLEMVSGRSFKKGEDVDNDVFIINETLAKQLGWMDPIGKTIFRDYHFEVVGVVKDFHVASMFEKVPPLIISKELSPQFYTLSIALNSANLPETISQLEEKWLVIMPNIPFNYSFLDALFGSLYSDVERTGKILLLFAVISILISVLGLFALTVLLLNSKRKEIGIRKVNGATIQEVLIWLNQGFIVWVILAFIVAAPLSFYSMQKWLSQFAYKTDLSWWVFALAGCIAIVIALLTVSWQTFRAARRNPVEALRYE